MKNLPLGINTFKILRENDCVYIDKTEYIHRLSRIPGRFFLSRPRRFGKSLLVDTIKELYEANEQLFRGLFIYDRWDWSRKYPVIKIDFASGIVQNIDQLNDRIRLILRENSNRLGIDIEDTGLDIAGYFSCLISKTAEKYGKLAVVLIDEYDKPILDNIDKPAVAGELREGLKNLYSVLKGQDANLQFIFMTGVSKFSKVSLFSGVNQLNDITIDAKYSSICGYTESDLKQYFHDYLDEKELPQIQRWYNGYGWTGSETVYNPYDILLFFEKGMVFRNYWFESGSPAFLIKLFSQNRYFLPNLEQLDVSEEILGSFEVEKINPVTLLFQSGYLTIESMNTGQNRVMYRMKIPNEEVRTSLAEQLLSQYTELNEEKVEAQRPMYNALSEGNLEQVVSAVKRLFAGIPWRNFTNNDLSESEGYYASVMYAFFVSLGARVIPEDITNHGQADMTVILGVHTYVLECKVIDEKAIDNNSALDQIISRGYAEKYRGITGTVVHEAGFIFSREARNVIKVDWN